MEIVVKEYTNEAEADPHNPLSIIADMEAQGYCLKADQCHLDGKRPIFIKKPRDLAAEVDEIKAKIADYDTRLKTLEGKVK